MNKPLKSALQSGSSAMCREPGRAVTLNVAGIPAPKGSRIHGQRADGTSYSRPASRREKSWTDAVALTARTARPDGCTLPPPYAVDLVFALPRPAKPSHPHPTRGDIDKLVRAVLDGLAQGGLILDDRHVTALRAVKRWAIPGGEGVVVTVAPDSEGTP